MHALADKGHQVFTSCEHMPPSAATLTCGNDDAMKSITADSGPSQIYV